MATSERGPRTSPFTPAVSSPAVARCEPYRSHKARNRIVMPTVGRASSIPVVAPSGRLCRRHTQLQLLDPDVREARTERAGRRMATHLLQGRIPESAAENARAVAGPAARDAVSIDAVKATTADDDSEAAAGQTSRPRRRRRIRPATSSLPRRRTGARPPPSRAAPRTRTRRRRLPWPAGPRAPLSRCGLAQSNR